MFTRDKLSQWKRAGLILGLLFLTGWPSSSTTNQVYAAPPAIAGPALSVDVSAQRHAISPDIYGLNFFGTDIADYNALSKELRLPVNRWGGNVTSRYNWMTNSFNSGFDYFFEGNPNTNNDPALGLPSESDEVIMRDRANGSKTIIAIPMLGYVSKNRTKLCGFGLAKYLALGIAQTADDGVCGNGIKVSDGKYITGNDPLDTSIAVGPPFAQAWINNLKSQFGNAASGGVKFYEFDNEPSGWHETHLDVHPDRLKYDELRDRTYQYGPVIKAADPTAKTLGPSNFGFYVWLDSLVPGDRAAHGGLEFSAWYLQQMKLYEQNNGVRILDYFDQHYYPAQPGVSLEPAGSLATQQLRLRATRSLWDATYDDESDIQANLNERVRAIPRFRDWVNTYYPGTKIAITEYNFGGEEALNGALAQADVLGIFGREQLDLATMWLYPPGAPLGGYIFSTKPAAYAFRMYRNYDGLGSSYGDNWVQSTSTDQGKLAVFGAQRTSDQALTLMVINKTDTDLTSPLSLAGFNPSSNARVYRYSATNLGAIVRQPDQTVSPGGFTATYPANSITMLVLNSVTTVAVTVPDDDGSGTVAGTLSRALKLGVAGNQIIFNLPLGVTTITVTGKLPVVPSGVNIQASCNAGKPAITLDGSNVTTNENGLLLSSNTQLTGLKITKFKGSQLKVNGTGNKLACLVATH